jgi:hypothetical protein
MRIDNNGDGVSDIQYVFRFRTVVSNPNTFLYNTGPVTSLDSPNLNIKQFYSVTVLRGNGTNVTSSTVAPATPAAGSPAGFPFAVPPVNVGPRSTPNYENNLGSPAVTAVNTTFGTAVVLPVSAKKASLSMSPRFSIFWDSALQCRPCSSAGKCAGRGCYCGLKHQHHCYPGADFCCDG